MDEPKKIMISLTGKSLGFATSYLSTISARSTERLPGGIFSTAIAVAVCLPVSSSIGYQTVGLIFLMIISVLSLFLAGALCYLPLY